MSIMKYSTVRTTIDIETFHHSTQSAIKQENKRKEPCNNGCVRQVSTAMTANFTPEYAESQSQQGESNSVDSQ